MTLQYHKPNNANYHQIIVWNSSDEDLTIRVIDK